MTQVKPPESPSPNPRIELHLLGQLSLSASGEPVHALTSGPKRVALLTYLVLAEPAGFHRRDVLTGLFWGETSDRQARASLRNTLHVLRRQLGVDLLVNRGEEEVGIAPSAAIWCDAVEFRRRYVSGDVEGALTLYRGDLLPGLSVPDAEGAEAWLEAQRAELRRLAFKAACTVADERLSRKEPEAAIAALRRACGLDPFDESVTRRLMALLDRSGDRAAALAAYEELARRLLVEFDAEPAPETSALNEAIRARRDPHVQPSKPQILDGEAQAIEAVAEPTAEATSAAYAAQSVGNGEEAAARRAGWRGGRIARVLFAAVLLVALGIAGSIAFAGRGSQASDIRRVAVFPFSVRGSQELQYLGDGFATLVGGGLDVPGMLQGVDPHTLLTYLGQAPAPNGDADWQRRAALHFGADSYLAGDVLVAGDRLRVALAWTDLTDAGLRVEKTVLEGSVQQMFALVDQISSFIIAQTARGEQSRAAVHATASVPALRSYLEGESAYRRGEYARAIEAYSRAVAVDSSFAQAYHRLSMALEWIGRIADAGEPAARAARYQERLPRSQQMLLEAHRAYRAYETEAAEKLFSEMVFHYPDAVEGWHGLAESRYHRGPQRGRPFTLARDPFERVLHFEPDNLSAILHLQRIAAAEGDRDRVASLTKRYLASRPDGERALEARALRAVVLADAAEEEAVARELQGLGASRAWITAWRAAVYARDPAAGIRLLRKQATASITPFEGARGHVTAAYMEAARGRWRESSRELERVERLLPDEAMAARALLWTTPLAPVDSSSLHAARRALQERGNRSFQQVGVTERGGFTPSAVQHAYLLGLVSAAVGDANAVDEQIRQLESVSDAIPGRELIPRLTAELKARASLIRRPEAPQLAFGFLEPWEEIDYFSGASALFAQHSARYLRADLLARVGREAEAEQWFGTFVEDNPYSIVYVGPALFRMAELAALRGSRADAAAHYRRLLALYRDADPELQPLVERVRRGLSTQSGLRN